MLRLSTALLTLGLLLSFDAHAQKASKLQKLFRIDMIGADVAYFEQFSGLARNTYDDTKIYVVSGCEVTANISNGTVRNLHISVSPTCTFDLNRLLPNFDNSFPPLIKLTFGQFDKLTGNRGTYLADCVMDCGNAADPLVYEHWYGSRADGVLEIMLESTSLPSWSEQMKAEQTKEWIWDGHYNCMPNKYQAIARNDMKNIKIDGITVGYDIKTPKCPLSGR